MSGVTVRIGANTEELDQAVNRSKSRLGGLSGEMRKGINQAGKYSAAMVAAGAAIAGGLAAQGLKAVDAQAKLARSLDTSINSVKALQMAARENGLDGMEGSLSRLNRRLGAAETGTGAAAKTVQALNLNLEELSQMPADERMASIADSIRDSGASMQQAARFAQDLGFEQREAASFFMQGGDAIRGYSQEVDDLGLSISDIDAAMIEQANDAMGVFSDIISSVSQQLAIEVAPVLTAVSNMIKDAAVEAGGFGDITSSAMDKVVTGIGWVADGMHGLRIIAKAITLAFQGVGNALVGISSTILEAWQRLIDFIVGGIENIIKTANRVPGIDIPTEGIEQFRASVRGAADDQADMRDRMSESLSQTAGELHDLAMQELPSDKLRRFVDESREAAKEAAEATIAERESLSERVIEIDQARSEAEIGEIQKRLDAIREAGMTEEELLLEKYEREREILEEALDAELMTYEEYNQRLEQIQDTHQQALTDIEESESARRQKLAQQEAMFKQKVMGDALSAMTTLMNSESRKMFEVGKAAAIGQSLIATYQGMAESLKLGWPMGPIAAAAIGVAGFANVQAIRSQSFGSGGGGAGSVTQQVSGNTQPVQQQEQGQQQDEGRTVRVEGVTPGSFISSEMVVDMLREATADGAVREFAFS